MGILSTPYAIKQGGWLGLVILCLFAVLAWYTGVLLRRCLDSKEGLETYPDIGHAAFGTTGRIAISVKSLVDDDISTVCFRLCKNDCSCANPFSLYVAPLSTDNPVRRTVCKYLLLISHFQSKLLRASPQGTNSYN